MVRQEIVEKVRQLQRQPERIRNISVIAHVDHGKSTLSDSLVCAAGLLSKEKAGDALVMDSMKEEKERGITIKASGISLPFDLVVDRDTTTDVDVDVPPSASHLAATADNNDTDSKSAAAASLPATTDAAAAVVVTDASVTDSKTESFLVNLIDSPGHVDFSPEVTAALRVTDGALVVVDCIEGVCVQTKTVLRQAIQERIKPVLFLNKLDRVFDLKMEAEDAYQALARTVESVNVVVGTYHDDTLGDVSVWPQRGTVAFGSGLHGWGFTLRSFARIWHAQFGLTVREMTERLWGDWFFDAKRKQFVTEQHTSSGRRLPRAFCLLVLDPLRQMQTAMKEDDVATYTKMMKRFGLSMPPPAASSSRDKDKEPLTGKKLLKAVMQSWLPAADAMLQMIVQHLPSPIKAQTYRVDKLYGGPLDDAAATAIRNCDPNGPLVMYVSKMVPTADHSRFYAFGRIFAGSLQTGQVVRIQGPDYVPGDSKSSDLHVKPLQGVYLMMGPSVESIGSCVCGNIVGLMGVDQYLAKCGTVTTFDQAHNFVSMKYSVAPIVRLAVEPENPAHLNKLVQGLKKLSKSDPLVQVSTSEDGEHVVAGCGELHLEVCFNMLKNDFMRDVPLRVSQPVVSYCEGIDSDSSLTVCGKSPNKLNRLFMTARPLGEELCKAIADGVVREDSDAKARAKVLHDEFKWDLTDARKIWCFGAPPNGQCNLLVDATKAVQYMHDVKESVCGSFKSLTNQGVFCGEPMRGVRIDITDAKIHPDAPHHGAGQMMPATRLAVYGCQIASSPCLLEPIYTCEVTVPQQAQQGVFQTLRQRRAVVLSTEDIAVGNSSVVRAYLPVKESFGFTQALRENTSGQAFPLLTFSHWDRMPGSLDDSQSLVSRTVKEIRLRKGMSEQLPQINDYHCKV